MKKHLKLIKLTSGIMALGTGSVFAHPGHGLYGSHWHVTDVIGFVGVAVAIAIALWLSESGK